MAGKADFTEEQWDELHRGATGAGLLVALSERGFTSTFKESTALAKFMAHSHAESSSQLVRELAAVHGSGWKVSSSPDEVREGTTTALKQSIALLDEKAADEVEAYRAFVLALAHAVSDSAKGGDEAEAAAIVAISDALNA
ncbi:MAG TPA: hypothetical protein VMT88_01180 [Actinomycetes bacterium]|nr:hypothetical protein [Actinomycetes bacterium]